MWRGSDIPRLPIWPFVVGLIISIAMLFAAIVGCTVHLVTIQVPAAAPVATDAPATTQPAKRSFLERLIDDI